MRHTKLHDAATPCGLPCATMCGFAEAWVPLTNSTAAYLLKDSAFLSMSEKYVILYAFLARKGLNLV